MWYVALFQSFFPCIQLENMLEKDGLMSFSKYRPNKTHPAVVGRETVRVQREDREALFDGEFVPNFVCFLNFKLSFFLHLQICAIPPNPIIR